MRRRQPRLRAFEGCNAQETEGEQNGERESPAVLGNPRDILLHPKPSL